MMKMTDEKKLREFLRFHIAKDSSDYYGVTNDYFLDRVTNDWISNGVNSHRLYNDIERFLDGKIPKKTRILDMACGCGSFVFYGLLRDLDVWGIDPESWKHEFIQMKCEVHNYPSKWKSHFIKGIGEALPFSDSFFDFITSHQTLEHVQDVEKCLSEMIRVLKPGGAIFLRAPDYRGTFEPHYRVPWLPLLPRSIACIYLRIIGRPEKGLNSINYVTKPLITRALNKNNIITIEPDLSFIHNLVPNSILVLKHVLMYFFNIILRLYAILFIQELVINIIAVKKPFSKRIMHPRIPEIQSNRFIILPLARFLNYLIKIRFKRIK